MPVPRFLEQHVVVFSWGRISVYWTGMESAAFLVEGLDKRSSCGQVYHGYNRWSGSYVHSRGGRVLSRLNGGFWSVWGLLPTRIREKNAGRSLDWPLWEVTPLDILAASAEIISIRVLTNLSTLGLVTQANLKSVPLFWATHQPTGHSIYRDWFPIQSHPTDTLSFGKYLSFVEPKAWSYICNP